MTHNQRHEQNGKKCLPVPLRPREWAGSSGLVAYVRSIAGLKPKRDTLDPKLLPTTRLGRWGVSVLWGLHLIGLVLCLF